MKVKSGDRDGQEPLRSESGRDPGDVTRKGDGFYGKRVFRYTDAGMEEIPKQVQKDDYGRDW